MQLQKALDVFSSENWYGTTCIMVAYILEHLEKKRKPRCDLEEMP